MTHDCTNSLCRYLGENCGVVQPPDNSELQPSFFIHDSDSTTSLPFRSHKRRCADDSCTYPDFCGAPALVKKNASIFAQGFALAGDIDIQMPSMKSAYEKGQRLLIQP